MITYKKSFIGLVSLMLLFISPKVYGQNNAESLKNKTIIELILLIDQEKGVKENEEYLRLIVQKAKEEKNKEYLITAYHIYAKLHTDENVLKYSDSIIDLSKKSSDALYPAIAYMIKGTFYYTKRDFKQSYENYKEAIFFAKKHKNYNIEFNCNYSIGLLKIRIGDHKLALDIFHEAFRYAKNNIVKVGENDYLNTIFALATTHNELKQLDSATYYNQFGTREALRFDHQGFKHHFGLNSGVINYFKNDVALALENFEEHTPYFERINDLPNLAIANFYLGKIFQKTQPTKAIEFYKKVDTIFNTNKDIHPVTRESFEHLINYYKKNGDYKNHLYYVNQLIKVDSVLFSNEIYLNKRIIKEYDIPKLVAEKENIISTLESKDKKSFYMRILLILILIMVIAGLLYQYNLRKVYKRKFNEILANKKSTTSSSTKKNNSSNLNDDVVNSVILNLEKFENNKDFLSTNISLQTLAKKMDTNSNYLSKIINTHKNLSFINYINELRINYCVEELKNNTHLRKFTIKAIANDMGFNNAESFSNAFYKLKGIKPSYFIREIEKLP